MFSKRLEDFRKELNLSQVEMAKKLQISESYYSLIENNKREASKKVLYRLVVLSNKPEEFWLYGINNDNDVINMRSDCEFICKAYDLLKECYLNEDQVEYLFNNDKPNDLKKSLEIAENLLKKAIRADLKHLYEKDKLK